MAVAPHNMTPAEHIQRSAAYLAHRARGDNVMVVMQAHVLSELGWATATASFLHVSELLLGRLANALGEDPAELAESIAQEAAAAVAAT